MIDIIGDWPQFELWLAQRGDPPYRARQIAQWIFARRASSFGQMTDLPQQLRAALERECRLMTTRVVGEQSAPDGTQKLVVELSGRGRVECVLLRDGSRRTICLSSQVGCAMGCVFCASGLDGVERSLTSGEIVEQALHLAQRLPATERLSHIVMMGMGEPLANLDRVLAALQLVSRPDTLGISPRRITISTVGLPPAIERLAEQQCQYNLAVSLHAPNDALRNELVPVNRKIGIASVMRAADKYFAAGGRRLTFEYVLLADINDRPAHAHELARLLDGRGVLLNVIPYNPVAGLPYRTPSAGAIRAFRAILMGQGVTVRFRQRKGSQINAACGQLRRMLPETSPP